MQQLTAHNVSWNLASVICTTQTYNSHLMAQQLSLQYKRLTWQENAAMGFGDKLKNLRAPSWGPLYKSSLQFTP